MKRKAVVLSLSSLVMVVVVVGGFVWHKHGTDAGKRRTLALLQAQAVVSADTSTETPSTIDTKQPTSAPISQGQALGASTDSSSSGSSLQTNVGQQSSGTATGSATAGTTASGAAQVLPTPDQFSQFDKYKPNTSPLFGDFPAGTGTEAKAGDTLTVVYKGWLTNGTLFDESKTDPTTGKLQAFQFKLGAGNVVAGWDQGMVGMKVGGIRLLIVPPSVGYGASDHGPVPGDSVMVFEVQLVAVQ